MNFTEQIHREVPSAYIETCQYCGMQIMFFPEWKRKNNNTFNLSLKQEIIEQDIHQSIKFFKDAFLTCPLCGEVGYITGVWSDCFTVKCGCTTWRTEFKISEV